MLRRYRFALRPGWLLLHVFIVTSVVVMAMLGRWQLTVSDEKHFNLRNFGYALQWWLFCIFFVGFWVRVMRDHGRNAARPERTDCDRAEVPAPAQEPVSYRRYVMPQMSDGPGEPVDGEHAAYNDYLRRLAAHDATGEQQ